VTQHTPSVGQETAPAGVGPRDGERRRFLCVAGGAVAGSIEEELEVEEEEEEQEEEQEEEDMAVSSSSARLSWWLPTLNSSCSSGLGPYAKMWVLPSSGTGMKIAGRSPEYMWQDGIAYLQQKAQRVVKSLREMTTEPEIIASFTPPLALFSLLCLDEGQDQHLVGDDDKCRVSCLAALHRITFPLTWC